MEFFDTKVSFTKMKSTYIGNLNMKNIVIFIMVLIFSAQNATFAYTNDFIGRWTEKISEHVVATPNSLNAGNNLKDKYNLKKDYFDYSIVLEEFPKDYYYTTVKINKSKERILIITDEVNVNNNSNHGLFYYFAKNGFVYPLGLIESKTPFAQSKNYLYYNDGNKDIKFYMSDKSLSIIKSKITKSDKTVENIEFVTIESADKFAGDFGEPAGDDVIRTSIDGFYFEYHKPQYKRKYIKTLMEECINDEVKTQVQMYCCMVKKLHP